MFKQSFSLFQQGGEIAEDQTLNSFGSTQPLENKEKQIIKILDFVIYAFFLVGIITFLVCVIYSAKNGKKETEEVNETVELYNTYEDKIGANSSAKIDIVNNLETKVVSNIYSLKSEHYVDTSQSFSNDSTQMTVENVYNDKTVDETTIT